MDRYIAASRRSQELPCPCPWFSPAAVEAAADAGDEGVVLTRFGECAFSPAVDGSEELGRLGDPRPLDSCD